MRCARRGGAARTADRCWPSLSGGAELGQHSGVEPAVSFVQVESIGLEVGPLDVAQPLQHALVLGMVRVGDCLDQRLVAVRAATILRRTRAFAGHADRVMGGRFGRLQLLEDDLVIPTVAKVVLILE